MADCSPNRFFGPVQTHIKPYQGSLVAVEGSNMTHKLTSLPSVKMPFQQILTSRIILRAGQTNYLLNHLGLGDNATFLGIVAQYDDKSKFESDNFIQYSYFSNKNRLFSFAQMMVLTGNSENRIEQLYLHNPNQNSPVILEVMVAVIDEYYNFFSETDGASVDNTVTYSNLTHPDVELWDEDDGILIVKNAYGQALMYLNLEDINSVNQEGKIVTIDESSIGKIVLIFVTEYDATQARVKITTWIDDHLNNQVSPPVDDFEPIITFTANITDDDAFVPPLTSVDGNRSYIGVTSISASSYGGIAGVTKFVLAAFIIDNVKDFEDTIITVDAPNDIIIRNDNGLVIQSIPEIGSYYIYFNILDNIGNRVNSNVNVKINIVA